MAESAEPYKEFIREMMVRFERVMREFSRDKAAMRQEHRERFDRVDDELRDLREQSWAATEALLRLIDRFDGGGTAAAS